MEVILPGGLPLNGGLERRARFRPLSGRIEQRLIETENGFDQPSYVTAVLAAALESIGSRPADAGCVADLCVADRQFLMLRLAASLNGEQMWLKVACGHCNALFDVDVRRCDLPVKPAGPDFPQVTLRTNAGIIDVRVPTGADQDIVAAKSEAQALQELLHRCIRSVNGSVPGSAFIDSLCAADIAAIDEALDAASPAVCSRLLVICPECRGEQTAELDHYSLAGINENEFYEELHTLASHYHWSEADILDLPQARRRRYLGLINRSAGMTA